MGNSDTELRNKYLDGRLHDNSRAVVFKFNTLRLFKENKEFIFVEGSSDEAFYKHTSISILTDGSVYIPADYTADKDDDVGKKVVYSAYESIRNNDELRCELDKCLFIIDRDYEYYKDNQPFTITEGHSMECYFLEQENVKIVFSYFNLPEEAAEKFWEMYVDFASKCYEFFALKGTWTYVYSKRKRTDPYIDGYKHKNEDRDIFWFKFYEDTYSFREDKLEEEIKLMRDSLNANERFIPYYQKLFDDIKDNPKMIRGHNAYDFLKQYLRQKHGIIIQNNLDALVPVIGNMGVELDIKQISTEA